MVKFFKYIRNCANDPAWHSMHGETENFRWAAVREGTHIKICVDNRTGKTQKYYI
jgi:hypothetical protein